jgi:phosphoribosylglycinamide formyltransferase 1
LKLAIFASGEGTLLQAVLDACKVGQLDMQPLIVISNNSKSNALRRASKAGLTAWHLNADHYFGSEDILDEVTAQLLEGFDIDLILLLGYMKKIGLSMLGTFQDKIINIHPSLLPKFGGEGMYDIFVHEAVIESGDTETGITIHVADYAYDQGRIVNQITIPISPEDTPSSLRLKVKAQEASFLIKTLQEIEGRGYV